MDDRRALCCNRRHARRRCPARAAAPAGDRRRPAFSPLYQQIKALITRSLQAGEWKPGEAIPSEIELAARFKVSQGTVRKAIDELAAENLLVRRQGKGTFVATHAEQQVQYRFLRLMPDDGDAPRRHAAPLPRLPAPARAGRHGARARRCAAGDAVLQVRRVLSFRGTAGRAGRHLAAGARCSRA